MHVFGILWRCLFWPSFCRLPWTWQEMRPVLFRKHYTLRDGVLVCFQLSRSLLLLIFNFLSPLLFWLVYKEFSNYYFITCIRNPTRLLTWSFLQKQLCVCVCFFFQKSPSLMFDGVLNTPLRWCMGFNLDGLFLTKFLTLSILLFYLYIRNFFTPIL